MSGRQPLASDAAMPAVAVDGMEMAKGLATSHAGIREEANRYAESDDANRSAESEAGEEEQEEISGMEWKLGDACRTESSMAWSGDGVLSVLAGPLVQVIDPVKEKMEAVSSRALAEVVGEMTGRCRWSGGSRWCCLVSKSRKRR